MLQNANAISAGGYDINNSLRFRSSASAYLNRTPAGAGNRKTWTWSAWIKRGALPGTEIDFFSASPSVDGAVIRFNSDNTMRGYDYSGGFAFNFVTTQVFRDPSAWYHIVFAYDSTQATSNNRFKLYVNGNQVTSFSSTTYPSLNQDTYWFNNANVHNIGRNSWAGASYLDGYLADVNFIDGSAKAASDFGETDTITGVWKPKAYTGTYGTNGFYLKFSDIATTSGSNAGLGKDFSGNSNYWTTNNISVTAGTTYDAMIDSPTLTSATVANYATLNPLVQRWAINAGVFSEANLKITTSGSSSSFGFATIFNSTGKWYWEGTLTAAGTATPGTGVGDLQCQSGTFTNLIEYNKDGTHTGAGANWATYTTGDVIGVAMDCDGGNIYFYKNNTLQGSVALTAGVSYAPLMDVVLNAAWAANFGQRPFTYTAPTGYVALNTYNLPTPTILQGNKYMDATLWTGNASTQVIVNNAQFKPDLVWMKARSAAYSNRLVDSVRGVGIILNSNTTGAEFTDTASLTSFNSNGFTVGNSFDNASGVTQVGWQWQAGQGSTSSNTSGSITSTISVNATAGFSVVTFTSNNTGGATVGHGLGVKPSMIILKRRPSTSDWDSYHTSLGATKGIALNTTAAATTSINYWNNTEPTSTVFTLGAGVNPASTTMLAYCWAEIAGFSKFGSYTGNGSADGPFVYTGFRPKFVMIKSSSGVENWFIMDSSRDTYNVTYLQLFPNLANAETSGSGRSPQVIQDFLSNGFKVRGANNEINTSSGTYIYAAFAESPFKNSLAR
jgi:hypothetical protein